MENPSLYEIKMIALRAARGAGYSWGMAEEAGFATAILHEKGFSGLAALLALLQQKEADRLSVPFATLDKWAEVAKPISSIEAGVFLLDRRDIYTGFDAVPIASPLLLIPFISQLVDDEIIGLSWQGADVAISSNEIAVKGDNLYAQTANVTLAKNIDWVDQSSASDTICHPPINWHDLKLFEQKTFVPETEHSRRFGAGDSGS